MIHLCTESPFRGRREIVLFGKGPSAVYGALPDLVSVGVNEAAVVFGCDIGIAHDWTVVRDLGGGAPRPWIVSTVAWQHRSCRWVRRAGNLYFDGRRVLGTDVPSSLEGRNLGVGTATVALQLAAEAGVGVVHLNGFDNFWGDDEPEYHTSFVAMGLDPSGYAEAFPASGTVDEQIALVRESMQYVIDRTGLEVRRVE